MHHINLLVVLFFAHKIPFLLIHLYHKVDHNGNIFGSKVSVGLPRRLEAHLALAQRWQAPFVEFLLEHINERLVVLEVFAYEIV